MSERAGYRKFAAAARALAEACELAAQGFEELADAAVMDNSIPHPRAVGEVVPADGGATLSVEDAAALLGISVQRAYDSVKAGELPVLRFGRRLRIPKHALGQFVRTRTWDGRCDNP
jgi:excisionase family DNA binding protein